MNTALDTLIEHVNETPHPEGGRMETDIINAITERNQLLVAMQTLIYAIDEHVTYKHPLVGDALAVARKVVLEWNLHPKHAAQIVRLAPSPLAWSNANNARFMDLGRLLLIF